MTTHHQRTAAAIAAGVLVAVLLGYLGLVVFVLVTIGIPLGAQPEPLTAIEYAVLLGLAGGAAAVGGRAAARIARERRHDSVWGVCAILAIAMLWGFSGQALAALTAFYGADHFRTASAMTMLGRALVYQKSFDEGVPLLERALAIQERVHGRVHPRVASALNDLGSAALQQGRLDEAESRFTRMLAIYREVYEAGHYLVGIATSNLASVLTEKKAYSDAERLYRQAIAIYERAQSPTHLNTGIGRIKLGRVLLRQRRFAEAEQDSLAGYRILAGQAAPSVSWLQSARTDLAEIYDALGNRAEADKYRAELEAARQ